MKTKLCSKSLVIILVLAMSVGILPMNALAASIDYAAHDDYYKVISKDDYELAPGIVESEIVLNNDEGSHRQVAHVVEVDPNNPYTKVMPSYQGMAEALEAKDYGVQIMSEQVAYAEANGYGNVVAAMNLSLSWYNSDYYSQNPTLVGEPLGYLVMDGAYYENSAGKTSGAQTCLVINFDEKDGEARPTDIPKTEIRSTSSDITGWEEQVIPANFGFLVKDGVNQYGENHTTDAASRSFVGIKADGTIVMVMNDGRQSPYSAGFNSYEMGEFMLSLGCVQAINGDGGGSSQFLSQRPGEELELHCSPSDGAPRATTHGILVITTAPATGEFVRAQVTTDNQYYTPGSSVQFDALGTDLVGTATEIPAEATWKLTDDSMGTIDDNGLFVSNGKVGDVTAQLIYNNQITGEATITVVVPEISFKQSALVLPYGEATELSLNVTTNEGLNTVKTKDGDIVFTLSDSLMGTIEGNVFKTTTDTTVTGGTITAVACGDTENAVTTTVKFGMASKTLFDFEDNYELIIDESLTGGDEDADTTKKYYYGWHMGDIRVDQFYGYRWTGKKTYPTSIGVQMGKEMYLVDESTGMVRNGEKSLAVNVDWTSVTSMGSKQMNVWFPEPIDASEATNVGMWIYVPDVDNLQDSLSLRWCGYKKDGSIANITTQFAKIFDNKQGFSDEGWCYVSVDAVANNLATVEYFQFLANDASASYINPMSDYTFYIDDVTVDYSDATIDRENPYFTNVTISNGDEDVALTDGYTVSDNTVTLFAYATDNTEKSNYTDLDKTSINVTVDGVKVTDGVSVTAGGKISVVDLKLSDGVHTLCFEINDNQGNKGTVTRKLIVGNGDGDVHFELDNPDYALLPAGSIMYLKMVADNLSDIEKITTKVRLDGCNDWALEGMEVAYGFEASYIVNENNEAFITIERTSEEVADTNVIAKLPVRIWMTSTYLNPEYIELGYVKDDPALQDKYYALTPYAMWLSDGVSIIHVFVDASEGVVTYTNGETDTFSSKEYDISTELNRYRNSKNDGDENFYQNKASFHIHNEGEAQSKEATCTEAGYEGRVFCTGCACKTVELYEHECDTHEGCGAVIEWGKTIPATGHHYMVSDGKLICDCDQEYIATGLVEVNSKNYYMVSGKLQSGWIQIKDDWYYFDVDSFNAVDTYNNGAVTFEFENDGKLKSGQWHHTSSGSRYYYGPDYYAGNNYGQKRVTIDGKDYVFEKTGYCLKGYNFERIAYSTDYFWYDFGEDGAIKQQWDYTGLYELNGYTYCLNNGVSNYGMYEWDGAYYYNASANYKAAVTNIERVCSITNGLLPVGTYRFGHDGKMVDKSVCNVDGTLYYFELGKISQGTGTFNVDGKDYVIEANGKVLFTGTFTDASGQTLYYKEGVETKVVKNGLVKDADGEIRYYVDDVVQYAGVVADEEGNLYYINSSKKAVKNCTYTIGATKTNGLIEAGTYEFGVDGKMILESEEPDTPIDPDMKNGLVKDADGEIRYYKDGVAQYAGVVADEEGNLYYINSTKKAVKNCTYAIGAARTNGLIEAGTYEFGADGKMVVESEKPDDSEEPETPVEPDKKNGLVKDTDGEIRYYKDGVAQYAGVVADEKGNLYYVNSTKKAVKNCTYTIGAAKTNGLIEAGSYQFDAEGKMIR